MSYEVAVKQLDEAGIDNLVKSINIPPRPSLLQDLQVEMKKDDPSLKTIAAIVGRDVALSAAVLRVVNSPFFGLSRRAESMDQAVNMLGLRQVGTLVTGLVARQAIKGDGPALTRFWDVSTKRAFCVSQMARRQRTCEPDLAQTFGLFCDLGIPLLMQRFPDYADTLHMANEAEHQSFVQVEQARHGTDHALFGALMARSWGLSQSVALAIRMHHDYTIFQRPETPAVVRTLVAQGLVAEVVIQRYAGLNRSVEWLKGGEAALAELDLDARALEDLCDDFHDAFDAGV
jgi:HD-like signal output (HDOD) protein